MKYTNGSIWQAPAKNLVLLQYMWNGNWSLFLIEEDKQGRIVMAPITDVFGDMVYPEDRLEDRLKGYTETGMRLSWYGLE